MDWESLAQEWLDGVVQRGREGWDRLSGRRQYLVVQCLQDMARLRANELAGHDVREELDIAEATMQNLGVVASIELARTVLDVLRDSIDMGGSILLGILGKIKF